MRFCVVFKMLLWCSTNPRSCGGRPGGASAGERTRRQAGRHLASVPLALLPATPWQPAPLECQPPALTVPDAQQQRPTAVLLGGEHSMCPLAAAARSPLEAPSPERSDTRVSCWRARVLECLTAEHTTFNATITTPNAQQAPRKHKPSSLTINPTISTPPAISPPTTRNGAGSVWHARRLAQRLWAPRARN